MQIRTYLDAGVLIAAARGTLPFAAKALAILEDPQREFVSSDYVRMEILPKPTFHRMREEVAFYEEFFRMNTFVLPFHVDHLEQAFTQACTYGLSAFDALHGVAAQVTNCDELVTSERPTSPLFRLKGVHVVSLH